MDSATPSSAPLQLGWGRFLLFSLIAAVPVGLLISSSIGRQNRAPFALLYVSLVGFFAVRWHVLRRIASIGELSASEFRAAPHKYILGPRWVSVLWFVGTAIAVVSLVAFQVARPR
jgi:hypothetical protein